MLDVYRYIELNPVRAGMIKAANEYSWPSYNYNALGMEDHLITPDDEYLSLGDTVKQRQRAYVGLFSYEMDAKLLFDIRQKVARFLLNQVESID